MRRQDREITEEARIEAFLQEQQLLRVAFYDAGEIYIVPVNYGYVRTEGRRIFYFHGARAGRKYELAKSAPSVGFEIDGAYRLCINETACGCTAKYQSVVGTGTLRLVEDRAEKLDGLNAIMRQTTGRGAWDYTDAAVDAAAVFRLDAVRLACKSNLDV